MRFYASSTPKDLKTVTAQGERIVSLFEQERGLSVQVKAIKRTGNPSKDHQWGFVVLESLFDTYLCHYNFRFDILSVTSESQLTSESKEYLECPESLLRMVEPSNNTWRDCVRTYRAAIKNLTADRLAQNVTLFLKKSYSTSQYSEPFFVLQRSDGDWFGIDCYGDRKFLSLGIDEIHAHCPMLVDVDALKPMDTSNLCSDCVNIGLLIYKENGSNAVLLGRPKTRLETMVDEFSSVPKFKFDLHGECFWA